MDALAARTGLEPPRPLLGLDKRPVRFPKAVDIGEMSAQIPEFLDHQKN
jgi:hypothetical protein